MATLMAAVASEGLAGESVTVSLELQPAVLRAGQRGRGRVRFDIAAGYHIYGPRETMGIPTAVLLEAKGGVRLGEPQFPPTREANYEALGGSLQLYEGETVVEFEVEAESSAKPGEVQIVARVDFQPCTDTVCERPRKGVRAAATLRVEGGLAVKPDGGVGEGSVVTTRAATAAQLPPVALSVSPGAAAGSKPNAFKDALAQGLLWALLAAFGWGVAASFSPCVYPMIPITVSYFGGQRGGGSASRRVALAATYVLGMTLMYAALGVVAARLGRDLGAWMVNPYVVGVLALVLVALACSMFGLYVLQLPSRLTNWLNSGDRGGYLEALFMGLALGFVAAPCVGPFAGSILVFVAQSGDVVIGFLTLFSFGLGMGLLFLVLAFSSGSLSILPRSGQWMVRLEHFFGYVLIGMALYLISNVVPEWSSLVLLGLYAILGGTFLGAFTPVSPEPAASQLWSKGLGYAAVVVGTAALLAGFAGSGVPGVRGTSSEGPRAESQAEGPWLHSLDEGFAQARRTGKPIFADFYADWCIPCKVMDRTTFRDAEVLSALRSFVAVKVDCTDPDGPGARYKNEVLKAKNMPYLAFFDAAGTHLADDSIEGKAETAELLVALERVARRGR